MMKTAMIYNVLKNSEPKALTSKQGFDFSYTFLEIARTRCCNHLVKTL